LPCLFMCLLEWFGRFWDASLLGVVFGCFFFPGFLSPPWGTFAFGVLGHQPLGSPSPPCLLFFVVLMKPPRKAPPPLPVGGPPLPCLFFFFFCPREKAVGTGCFFGPFGGSVFFFFSSFFFFFSRCDNPPFPVSFPFFVILGVRKPKLFPPHFGGFFFVTPNLFVSFPFFFFDVGFTFFWRVFKTLLFSGFAYRCPKGLFRQLATQKPKSPDFFFFPGTPYGVPCFFSGACFFELTCFFCPGRRFAPRLLVPLSLLTTGPFPNRTFFWFTDLGVWGPPKPTPPTLGFFPPKGSLGICGVRVFPLLDFFLGLFPKKTFSPLFFFF